MYCNYICRQCDVVNICTVGKQEDTKTRVDVM